VLSFRILRVASRGATASAVMVVVVVAMCLQYLGKGMLNNYTTGDRLFHKDVRVISVVHNENP
jgi:hypothetical protein